MDMTLVKMRGTAILSEFQPHRRVPLNTDLLSMDMTLVWKLQQLRRTSGTLAPQGRRYQLS